MLRAQTQIAELASAFAAASIRVMVLKGAHLAQVVYPNLTLRAMQDIDLLVSREHLEMWSPRNPVRFSPVAQVRGDRIEPYRRPAGTVWCSPPAGAQKRILQLHPEIRRRALRC
jgi:hypothetical protein